MIRRLDHIAIAVPDIQRAITRFAEDLGLSLAGTEDVPTEKTSTAFLPIEGTRIELVTPMGGEGPIAKFIGDYLFRGGFLDGYHGFVIARISAHATFLKYAKLKQLWREKA